MVEYIEYIMVWWSTLSIAIIMVCCCDLQDTKHCYTVHYFGSLPTNKSEGVEAVTEPLQVIFEIGVYE